MTAIVEEYYSIYDQYAKKYEKVCLLMQVGGFYELYCTEEGSRSNAPQVCADLDMRLVIKDPRNSSSAKMAGFPVAALDFKVRILLEKTYTVIVVDQGPPDEKRPSAKRERKITQVISQATDINGCRSRNQILAVFCEKYRGGALSFGLASIDTTLSREVLVHEIHSVPNDKGIAMDNAIEFVTQTDPVECVVVTRNGEKNLPILNQLGLTCPTHFIDIQGCRGKSKTLEEPCHTPSVHISNALDALLVFLEDHFYRITDFTVAAHHSERFLDLSSTAILQLDLPLLYTTVNRTLTAMGSRLLRNRLMRPLLHSTALEEAYEASESLTEMGLAIITQGLKGLPDLERLHRKMSLGKLDCAGMRSLHAAYLQAIPLLTADVRLHELSARLSTMMEEYGASLQLESEEEVQNSDMDIEADEGAKVNTKVSTNDIAFFPGVHQDLDEQVNNRRQCQAIIKAFLEKAKRVLPCETYKIKENLGLQTTHLRAETLRKKCPAGDSWKVRKVGAFSYVYDDELEAALIANTYAESRVNILQRHYFGVFLDKLYQQHGGTMDELSQALAELDVLRCSKVLTASRRLARPRLVKKRSLLISGLRHLIIEDIHPDVRYVENDCLLGEGSADPPRVGMTLYGVNACGKSSYLKATGLAVIMAQAGLYVPADTFTYKPFTRIMTRIAGGDSIEKGQSSFVVELLDLGSVISRADENTLVLGDEMCRGTEIASAEALVHSTLATLVEKRTLFVTATHLHGIAEDIERLQGVDIFHMEVTFDEDGDPIYDRKLRSGAGAEYYGLEIARAQGFPTEFMKRAMEYRNRKTGTKIVQGKQSRYNSKKILVACEACQYRPVHESDLPLDTHHVNFQCQADKDGFHGTQSKDAAHNLICLCKQCHIDVHKGVKSLTLLQSLKGRKVVVRTR